MSQTTSATRSALALFEPGIADWFGDSFPAPTRAQARAWPLIAAGEHVLVTAPTGSGKTLTAFLWALNQFASGRWRTGATRVVYVSPLKALNNDIERNLLGPLSALSARGAVPELRVATRSGDTPQSDRQRMLRRPPEILITTPESLTLLLTGTRGRHMLSGVETVILDEVHALVDNRRGTLVLTALERLVRLGGEFQRIALSATVQPLDRVAAYVAGRDESGTRRAMQVVEAGGDKAIDLTVRFPEAARRAADRGQKIWEPLAAAFREIIRRNAATLFFTNSRRLAERLTFAINQDQPSPLAYAHHGSLAREIRLEVEARLKRGELKAIVATSSLEMGIDIGDLDQVVMIQSPPSIAATLQRIGRAGHRVGEVSRGVIFPAFAQDFVSAAALAEAVAERDIEPLVPLGNPLDVLAQIIVSMTATEPWPVEELFELLRRSGPYEHLPRGHFDLVVEMLAGRYGGRGRHAGARVRELKPRISYDRIRQEVKAQHGAVLALYSSGGVIPDRGYFHIRHSETGAVIGELDEEFVWEAQVGQIFTLGTQNWQIHRITHDDVLVRPTAQAATTPPFWRAESRSRSVHFSERIAGFLERAEARLTAGPEALRRELTSRLGFDAGAAAELTDYLQRQREVTGTALPHRRHLVAERVLAGPGGHRGAGPLEQLVIHSLWGGRLNRPWALALGAALHRDGVEAEIHAADDAVSILCRQGVDADAPLRLVTPDNLEPLLRVSLESSGLFGARFREAAGRALLVTRQRFNARLPLWMSRLQAKKLMSAVADFEDFPLLLETWRSCLMDEFDLPALQRQLEALADGTLAVSICTTESPSPFAANLSFAQISRYMYADDAAERGGPSALSDELIRSALSDVELRPRLTAETVAAFLSKRQRTAPGYAPESEQDWAEWIKERVLVPTAELDAAVAHPDLVEIGDGAHRWLCHRELLYVLQSSGLAAGLAAPGPAPAVEDGRSAEQLALEVLSFYGPLTEPRLREILPHVPPGLLEDEDVLVRGPLMENDPELHYCEAENYQALLRLQRALRRPRLEARPATALPAYVATWQGLGTAGSAEEWLEPLRGYRAPAAVWLWDLPAARSPGVAEERLDQRFVELGLAWQGAGPGQVRIGYPEDLLLLDTAPQEEPAAGALFADPAARYGFLQLADRLAERFGEPFGEPLAEFNRRWWQWVWAGAVAADTLTPLRQGVSRDWKLGGEAPRRARSARSRRGRAPRYARSAYADPWAGNWMLLPRAEPETDPLLALEDAKDRARMLLDRYGLVCRELANREGGLLRWQALFRALRVMELAGEVVAGYFFRGLSGPQFVPPAALATLQGDAAPPRVFWCNAVDPLSPCGLGLDWPELPQRRPRNYVAFHQGELAGVIENGGRRIELFLAAGHPDLAEVLAPLAHLLARQRRVTLEQVNGVAAADSPYLAAFESIGRVVSDHRSTYLEAATLQP